MEGRYRKGDEPSEEWEAGGERQEGERECCAAEDLGEAGRVFVLGFGWAEAGDADDPTPDRAVDRVAQPEGGTDADRSVSRAHLG